jgi:hypothetical protein
MNKASRDPEISSFLRNFTFVEASVLVVVGFGLFLFPQHLRPQWAWEIAPFNARFLGGIYLSAMAPVALMYLSGRWSPTRLVLPAIFTFTFVVLVASLYHIDRFNLAKWQVWIWFALYVALPASAGYHLWLYRKWPRDHLPPTGGKLRITLQVSAVLFGVYGVGLIVAPDFFSGLFPWRLDHFHSQLYSAVFLTGFVMMLTVAKRATHAEMVAAGVMEIIFGVFSILGLVIVDREVHKIDWSATNTIVWLALLVVITAVGIAMVSAKTTVTIPEN